MASAVRVAGGGPGACRVSPGRGPASRRPGASETLRHPACASCYSLGRVTPPHPVERRRAPPRRAPGGSVVPFGALSPCHRHPPTQPVDRHAPAREETPEPAAAKGHGRAAAATRRRKPMQRERCANLAWHVGHNARTDALGRQSRRGGGSGGGGAAHHLRLVLPLRVTRRCGNPKRRRVPHFFSHR